MELMRKTVAFEIKALSEDDNFFFFEGFGSTFDNVDLHEDVMVKGAFTESLGKRMPKLIWQHKQDEPIGIYTSANEDAIGLFVKGKLPKDDTFVTGRVIPQMKVGSVTDMSIGFNIPDWEKDVEIRDGIRFITRVDLWEVSLVTIPANERANVLAMKAATSFKDLPLADVDMRWDANAAKARVRAWAGAEEGLDTPAIQRKYRDCFFWYDSSEPDTFASYKLPFTDIIDGKLTAIPRGLFAAAAAIQGARGGVDIPDADKPGVIRHMERYYAKMDRESPFTEERAFRVESLQGLDERTLESLFKGGVCFTGSLAKALVRVIKESDLREAVKGSRREGEDGDWSDVMGKLNEITKSMTTEEM